MKKYIAHVRLDNGGVEEVPYSSETDEGAINGVKTMIEEGIVEGKLIGIVETVSVFDLAKRVVYWPERKERA